MQHWERVEAFIAVVRFGSFAAAARELQVSNSHVSRLVSQLEQQLGTQLLYRTTRQIRLTDAGQLYYDSCRHLFDGLREAESLLQHHQGQPTGLLKITAATTFGDRYIAPLVNDFQLLYPQLKVQMYFSNRQVELIEEGFDLAIRMGVMRESTLIAKRLCDRREYIVGSPDYLARISAPQTLTDLERHNCLVGTRGYWLLSDGGQRKDLQVRGNWQANSGPALLDAALKGLGLAQLPDYYVDEFLADGRLVKVLDDYRFNDAGVWVVYPQQRHLAPKVRLFIDFLAERFAGGVASLV
ncbi:LysR family transcriptional regulator [Cellvibrio sp. KY-YJ-3]|uniref:LysR family transcriptional regulator n=1 Tax=Cellvibrio sp. KY-YJ-3 TaxID=454662 RepID=UPI0012456008|nr:LysR family transcriptional regulator [Cellvibrio sp. KY-YJ-3]QEY11216.1 LysR family transcriptional regulator [Cellvibrio sp. KY-YJ-3]